MSLFPLCLVLDTKKSYIPMISHSSKEEAIIIDASANQIDYRSRNREKFCREFTWLHFNQEHIQLSYTVEPLLADTSCKWTPLISGHHS